MAFNVTGAAIASLVFDVSDSPGDQMGFLLGQVNKHVKDAISDSQINFTQVETKIDILSHTPIRDTRQLFDRAAAVSMETLQTLADHDSKTIVGWYQKRSNSILRPSLRDRSRHRNLQKYFSDHMSPENFVMCLFTDSATSNQSTVNLDHTFFVSQNATFKPVSLTITNLGYTVHTDYKHTSPAVSLSHLTDHFTGEFEDDSGASLTSVRMEGICEQLNRTLCDLCATVVDGENGLRRIEQHIAELEARVSSKLQAQTSAVQDDSPVLFGSSVGSAVESELIDLRGEVVVEEAGVHDSVMRTLKAHGLLELDSELSKQTADTSRHSGHEHELLDTVDAAVEKGSPESTDTGRVRTEMVNETGDVNVDMKTEVASSVTEVREADGGVDGDLCGANTRMGGRKSVPRDLRVQGRASGEPGTSRGKICAKNSATNRALADTDRGTRDGVGVEESLLACESAVKAVDALGRTRMAVSGMNIKDGSVQRPACVKIDASVETKSSADTGPGVKQDDMFAFVDGILHKERVKHVGSGASTAMTLRKHQAQQVADSRTDAWSDVVQTNVDSNEAGSRSNIGKRTVATRSAKPQVTKSQTTRSSLLNLTHTVNTKK